MDVVRTVELSGFDSQGDPEIRVLADGKLYVVFNFMPPSDFEERDDFGPYSDFENSAFVRDNVIDGSGGAAGTTGFSRADPFLGRLASGTTTGSSCLRMMSRWSSYHGGRFRCVPSSSGSSSRRPRCMSSTIASTRR